MSRKINIHSEPNTDNAWIFSQSENLMIGLGLDPRIFSEELSTNWLQSKVLSSQDLTRDVKGLPRHEDGTGDLKNKELIDSQTLKNLPFF